MSQTESLPYRLMYNDHNFKPVVVRRFATVQEAIDWFNANRDGLANYSHVVRDESGKCVANQAGFMVAKQMRAY